jgi:seryl-tRNA synthetase
VRQKDCQEVEKLTKKEFLNQYLNAEKEIGIKLDQISRLRELSTKITQTLTPDKVKSNSENRLESSVSKIVDIEREIGTSIDQLERIRLQVESVINSVPNVNQRNVLRLRYISGMKWEQIAVKLNYDYRWVLRLHGKALNKIAIESHS